MNYTTAQIIAMFPAAPLVSEMVAAVKLYAQSHYGKFSWDYVVECLSDSDIEKLIGKARTVGGAIQAVWAKYVKGINSMVSETRW